MILITGGLGYIGSHINKKLNEHGYQTIVIDDLSSGHIEFSKWGKFYQVDLRNYNDTVAVLKQHPQIQSVIHCAASSSVRESRSKPELYYHNNVTGTINLLQAMLECNVENIIFSSTSSVYGEAEFVPITEEHRVKPISVYGRSKLFAEEMIKDYAKVHRIYYCFLRYFNACGGSKDIDIGEWHVPEEHLIPKVIDAAIHPKNELYVFGDDYNTNDGTCVRDYIHVDDIAQAHLLALEKIETTSRNAIFNLGGGNGFSVKEIIRNVEEFSNTRIPFVVKKRRLGDPAILISDSSKIRNKLKWSSPNSKLSAIISSAYQWRKKLWQEKKL